MGKKKSFIEKIANRRAIYIALMIVVIIKMIDILEWIIVFYLDEYTPFGPLKIHIAGFVISLVFLVYIISKFEDVQDT